MRPPCRPAPPGPTEPRLRAVALAACLLQPEAASAEAPPLPPAESRPPLLQLEQTRNTAVHMGYLPNASWIVKDTLSTGPSIALDETGRATPMALGTLYEPGAQPAVQDPEQRQWNPVIRVQHFFRGWSRDWEPFVGAGGLYYWHAQARHAPSEGGSADPAGANAHPASRTGSMWATVFETGLRYRVTERADLVFAGQFAPFAATTALHLQASEGARFGESTALFSWDGVIGLTSVSWRLGS